MNELNSVIKKMTDCNWVKCFSPDSVLIPGSVPIEKLIGWRGSA